MYTWMRALWVAVLLVIGGLQPASAQPRDPVYGLS